MTIPHGENIISCCITDEKLIRDFTKDFAPTHVIHCAGVCDLDVCEERPSWAKKINVEGAKTITKVFGQSTRLIYLSTDLVFSGENPPPGGYAENAPLDPVSVAGKTFAKAEREISCSNNYCIIRLGLPVGKSVTGNKGGYDWIQSRFKRNLPVTLFYDEFRSCISCERIADMTIRMLKKEVQGIFHYGGQKSISLYELGKFILQQGNFPENLYKGIFRKDEKEGPPRIGDVTLNSQKIINILGEGLSEYSPLTGHREDSLRLG